MRFSDLIVPCVFALILLAGLFSRRDVFSDFCEGAADGLENTLRLLPTLVGLMTCIGMLRASGALELLSAAVGPLTERIGIPAEILPLALLRPFSGSGSLSLCQQLITRYGPDSRLGRIASVLQGSSETTFYTISLYYGSISVTRTRYAIPASLAGDLACLLCSCWTVQFLFG